jgi:hypothetical protein
MPEAVNSQVFVPASGQVKAPTPRVDQVLFKVVPFLATAAVVRDREVVGAGQVGDRVEVRLPRS